MTEETKVHRSTLYAELYRPLVERMRRMGMKSVGKGGWQGRWRSFHTGHPGSLYAVERRKGKPNVYLFLNREDDQERYRALLP